MGFSGIKWRSPLTQQETLIALLNCSVPTFETKSRPYFSDKILIAKHQALRPARIAVILEENPAYDIGG